MYSYFFVICGLKGDNPSLYGEGLCLFLGPWFLAGIHWMSHEQWWDEWMIMLVTALLAHPLGWGWGRVVGWRELWLWGQPGVHGNTSSAASYLGQHRQVTSLNIVSSSIKRDQKALPHRIAVRINEIIVSHFKIPDSSHLLNAVPHWPTWKVAWAYVCVSTCLCHSREAGICLWSKVAHRSWETSDNKNLDCSQVAPLSSVLLLHGSFVDQIFLPQVWYELLQTSSPIWGKNNNNKNPT